MITDYLLRRRNHLDSRVALIRAITEAAQTRAANIQGARDDLKRMDTKRRTKFI